MEMVCPRKTKFISDYSHDKGIKMSSYPFYWSQTFRMLIQQYPTAPFPQNVQQHSTMSTAWLLATEWTRSSLRACEPATLHCWKPTPVSSNPPQTPCEPFSKRCRRRLMQLGKTYLEVLLRPSRFLPPTLKGCWRSQESPSGRPLALKPQQQQQQQQHRQLTQIVR